MRKYIITAFALAAFACFTEVKGQANDKDKSYLSQLESKVEQRLRERRQILREGNLFAPLSIPMTSEERRAMKFLYAYMHLSDIADYDATYHLSNVRTAFRARRDMPWGKQVSDKDFYHFVLPARVNNEGLDSARQVLFAALGDRVRSLPMAKAVIEVNRWCHERVTYSPSDARTSAPLSTIRSAYGRCGEESTLLVSALRAVGIPARQVYTPRWAHTDDNHAWVEAKVDGSWQFLGACEPEPVLNLGWFNAPASRAMLVHTKVLGDYMGDEPVISRNHSVTEINVTKGYAPVSFAKVRVLDDKGKPVADAKVEFRIYNYSEFYTVGVETSNKQGEAQFLAGHGDMLVWVRKGDRFGFAKLSFGKDRALDVSLRYRVGDSVNETIDITPPTENARYPKVSEQERAENTRLLAREDSIRNAYVASFVDKQYEGLDARGNWEAMRAFVDKAKDKQSALILMKHISAKDRRDAKAEVLADHLERATLSPSYGQSGIDSALLWSYVYNPRVATEVMSPYRSQLMRVVPVDLWQSWQQDLTRFVTWCQKSIRVDERVNPHTQPVQPMGMWRSRVGDQRSVEVFFVSVTRSLGYAARINEVSGKVQYLEPGSLQWVDVRLSGQSSAETKASQGKLYLDYKHNGIVDNPTYYTHFSLSRIGEDASLSLQSYDVDDKGLEQGASWRGLFSRGVEVDAGDYLLVSGSRMASGNVLAQVKTIKVKPGKEQRVELVMRRDSTQVAVIGNFDAESKYTHWATVGELLSATDKPTVAETEKSILSTTGRGYYILGILGAQQEPSNHALRDLASLSDVLDEWGRPMMLLLADDEAQKRYKPEEFPKLPQSAIMGVDRSGDIRRSLIKEFKLVEQELPIFVIADTFNRVVYVKQGYTIGLGEQLKAVIAGLRDGKLPDVGACTKP